MTADPPTLLVSAPGSPPIARALEGLRSLIDVVDLSACSPARGSFRHSSASRAHMRAALADTAYIIEVRAGRLTGRSIEAAGLRRSRRVAIAAATYLRRHPEICAVISSTGSALEPFRWAVDRDVPRVLSFPQVHHDELRRQAALDRDSEFATTFQRVDLDRETRARVNAELDAATTILTPTDSCMETLVAAGARAESIVVAPYGVDHEYFARPPAGMPTGREGVIFVGQLTQRKGISDVIQAARRLPDVRFTLVGPDPFGLANRIQLSNVAVTGKLSRERLRAQLHQHAIFVLPSRGEGLPLATLEAAAAGCVPVISRQGGGGVFTDRTGRVIENRDIDGLTTAIRALSDDRELQASLRHEASAYAATFDWSRFTSALMSGAGLERM